MKNPWALFILSLLLLPLGQGRSLAAASRPDVLLHDIKAVLSPEEKTLRASDTLTVETGGAEQLELFLSPNARIDKLMLGGRTVPYRFADGRLVVELPASPPAEITMRVDYRAVFYDPVPEAPMHSEDPTYGVAAALTPGGTFLSGSAGWYPDIPGGAARYRVRIEAPEGTDGVTSGRLLERGEEGSESFSVWETDSPLPSLTLAAGPYEVRKEMSGEIPVYTYFRPETSKLAPTYLAAAKKYLELYQNLFGPYPFEKFAVVENFFPTGYGFPSWTLLGSTVVRLPFIVETSLGHEIAHSWWGNGVRVDYSGGNWSEGLTTYVADYLYKERASAGEALEYRLKILRDYATLVSPAEDLPLSAFMGRSSAAGQAIGYGKGAMVFHMLRRQIGDENFWSGLRRTAREKMFNEISWSELMGGLGKSAGEDLTGFYSQWVEREGAPVLSLEGVQARRAGDRWEVTGRLRQEAPFYRLFVPLRLETRGAVVNETLELNGETASFDLTASSEPTLLTADPEFDLFRRLDPAEIPPTVNGIRGSQDLLAVVSRTLPKETSAAAATLLEALRQEGAPMVPEEKVRKEDLAGHDILFLGFPSDQGLLPISKHLKCDRESCTVAGERFAGEGTVLFAALPHPAGPKRTAAIFVPFSAAAARAAVRKIPHYGKYSYLVFDSGVNRLKGTWPSTESPLIHRFTDERVKP